MRFFLTLVTVLTLCSTVQAQPRILEVLVQVDHEFYLEYGDGTNDRVKEIFNGLAPWFDSDLDIEVQVIRTIIQTDPVQPFTETNCAAALGEFRTHGDAAYFTAGLEHDHAILLTRKVLTGGSGHAYQFGICSENSGGTLRYSVGRDFDNLFLTRLLVAHEIGHNLGAQHEPLTASPRRIMYPTLNNAILPEFAPLSITQIMNVLAGTVCLDDPASLNEWSFVRGDTNDDGLIDVTDAANIFDYAFNGATVFCPDACDFDDDGFVVAADSIALLNYLFTQGPPPAAPFPSYGQDVGADSISCGGL